MPVRVEGLGEREAAKPYLEAYSRLDPAGGVAKILARILLAVIMVPRYMKGEIYSPYQLLGDHFGPSARRTAGKA